MLKAGKVYDIGILFLDLRFMLLAMNLVAKVIRAYESSLLSDVMHLSTHAPPEATRLITVIFSSGKAFRMLHRLSI